MNMLNDTELYMQERLKCDVLCNVYFAMIFLKNFQKTVGYIWQLSYTK